MINKVKWISFLTLSHAKIVNLKEPSCQLLLSYLATTQAELAKTYFSWIFLHKSTTGVLHWLSPFTYQEHNWGIALTKSIDISIFNNFHGRDKQYLLVGLPGMSALQAAAAALSRWPSENTVVHVTSSCHILSALVRTVRLHVSHSKHRPSPTKPVFNYIWGYFEI